jgi:hypothetical protein
MTEHIHNRTTFASSISTSKMRTKMFTFAALSIYNVHGYVASVPISRPSPQVFHLPDIELTILPPVDASIEVSQLPAEMKPTSMPFDASATISRPQKRSYDLGLGKNSPVTRASSTKDDMGVTGDKVFQATQYWSEYESVRDFPSPQSQMTVEFEKRSPNTKKTRKQVPLHLKRAVQDSLTFLPSTGLDAGRIPSMLPKLPVMVHSDSSQLDVNSVWVEMLIHSEQLRQNGFVVS